MMVVLSITWVTFFDSTDKDYALMGKKVKHTTYVYNVENVVRVSDGDTFDLTLDLGFNLSLDVRVRLAGIDCPESGTPEGAAARAYTDNWLSAAMFVKEMAPLTVRTSKALLPDGSFGRWLGEISQDGVFLADALKKAGHVKR